MKATPKFTHNATSNKVNKGKKVTFTMNGQVSALTGKKVVVTLNGGSKKTYTTNDDGKFAVKFNTKGTYKVKLVYAGSTRYAATSKKFTIQVV